MTAREPFIRTAAYERTFSSDVDFRAYTDAERFLASHGYSTGPMQSGAPTAVMRGDWSIAKWRNLTPEERYGVDGTIEADSFRNGPVVVRLREPLADAATAEAS